MLFTKQRSSRLNGAKSELLLHSGACLSARLKAMTLAIVAVLSLTSASVHAQVCNTILGGTVYADACCFKIQPVASYFAC